MNTVQIGWGLAAVLAVMTAATALLVGRSGLGPGRDVLVAAVRAVLQLGAVSLIIGFVLKSPGWTAAFLALMVLVAAGTSARRITGSLQPRGWLTGVAVLAGLVPTLGSILLARPSTCSPGRPPHSPWSPAATRPGRSAWSPSRERSSGFYWPVRPRFRPAPPRCWC